jgi:hypothetical protein
MLKQPFRLFDFGEIMPPRVEFSQDGSEHGGYRFSSTTCVVQARKSKCGAQLERPRLLASGDFQGSVEGIFGTGNVRRVITQQKFTLDAIQFGIKPMLTGLLCPCDQFPQNV